MSAAEKISGPRGSPALYFQVPACTLSRKFNKIEFTFPITQPFKSMTNSEFTEPEPDMDMAVHGLHSVVCHF